MADAQIVDAPVVAEPQAEPITAFVVVVESTVIGEYADPAKAVAAAANCWNAVNQAITVVAVGIPDSLKGVKSFGWQNPVSIYSLPDLLRLENRERFTAEYTPRA